MKFTNSLDHVKIAAPCTADWDQMFSFEGERVRFCSQCNLNVYNLSAMTQDEAKALLYKTEGRLCVRLYRRSDGTVLTQNCPVGLRALKRQASWAAQVLLGMLVSLLAGFGLSSFGPTRRLAEIRKLSGSLQTQHKMMGVVAYPVEMGKVPLPLPEKTKKSIPTKNAQSKGTTHSE